MRFIGVVGALVAAFGLVVGGLGFLVASNILQQITCALGVIAGMLGLIAAAVAFGVHDLREIARKIYNNVQVAGNALAVDRLRAAAASTRAKPQP